MNTCFRFWGLTLAVILILGSAAMSFGDSEVSKREREKAVSTLDEMYTRYLGGTVSEARSNLVKAAAFIHEHSARIPELQSALPICYARLSLLERRTGSETRSRLYFEKSRYWRIVEREKLGLSPEEILADHEAFTRDESDKYVLEWDKKRTKGSGPKYLENPNYLGAPR